MTSPYNSAILPTMPRTVSAQDLILLQTCQRKYIIQQQYQYLRWNPKALFTAIMRRAIARLGQGLPVTEVSSSAKTQFLQAARSPGLDVLGEDPFIISKEYCGLLATTLEFLSRGELPALGSAPVVPLSSDISWQCLAQPDKSGQLHRWVFLDAFGEDDLARELHGWPVFGDIAAAQAPMMLHVLVIGQRRDGRRASPWVRAFRQAAMPSRIQFQRKSGAGLQGDWKPVWFQDSADPDPVAWVDRMIAERVPAELVHHLPVKGVSEAHRQSFIEQVTEEVRRMEALREADPFSLPMSRGACDFPTTCQHQAACYGSASFEWVGSGLYQIKAC